MLRQTTYSRLAARLVRVLFILSLASLLSVAPPATAQSAPSLTRLEVDLWPEYDRPAVLVLYRISLDAAVALPVELGFRIPASAGQPHAVAGIDAAAGALLNIPFTSSTAGEWVSIDFTSASREVQIEYYDPGLSTAGDLKSFTFTWPGDYAVAQFAAQVQQPAGASNLQTDPALPRQNIGDDGLTYFNGDLGPLAAGQSQTISVSYKKSGTGLSVQSIQPLAPTAIPASPFATPSSTFPKWLVWVLAGVGLVLIAGGGFWFWQTQRGEPRPARKRARRRPSDSASALTLTEAVPSTAVFCHNCGTRAQPGDVYCRKCGTRLRV